MPDDVLKWVKSLSEQKPVSNIDKILDQMRDSVVTQESGGNPKARNARTSATGLFQVLPSNIPSWSKRYTGRSYTPDEFAKDTNAQEKVFRGEMGRYLQKAMQAAPDEDTAIRMALAGWYGGEGAMRRYDDPNRFRPNEPSFREYTNSILGRMRKGQKTAAPMVDEDAVWSGINDILGGTQSAMPAMPEVNEEEVWGSINNILGATQPAQPSVPQPIAEPLGTLNAQIASTIDANSPKAATLITTPEQIKLLDTSMVKALQHIRIPNGILLVNPTKAQQLGVTDYERDFAKLIGKAEDVGNNTAGGLTLVTKDAQGNELNASIVTSPNSIAKQAALDKQMFPGGTQQLVKTEEAANARRAAKAQEDLVIQTLGGSLNEQPAVNPSPSMTFADADEKYGNQVIEVDTEEAEVPTQPQQRQQAVPQQRSAQQQPEAPQEEGVPKGGKVYYIPTPKNLTGSARQYYMDALANQVAKDAKVPYETAYDFLIDPQGDGNLGQATESDFITNLESGNPLELTLDEAAFREMRRKSLMTAKANKERADSEADYRGLGETDENLVGMYAYRDQLQKAYDEGNGLMSPKQVRGILSSINKIDAAVSKYKADKQSEQILADRERQGISQRGTAAPLDLSGVSAARFGAGNKVGADFTPTQTDTLKEFERIKKDVEQEHGSFLKKYQDDYRKEQIYGGMIWAKPGRALARPTEFILNFAREFSKLPGQASNVLGMGLDAMSTAGINPKDNPFIQFGEYWKDTLEKTKNPDLKNELIVGDVAQGLAQLAQQSILVPFTGGFSTALPILQAAEGQYMDAANAGADRGQRLWAGAVGGLAAVPDAILQLKFLKNLNPLAKADFLDKLTADLYTGLAKKLTQNQARQATIEFVSKLVTQSPAGYFGEKYQERLEDVINKAAAKVSYKPGMSWEDVVTATPREEQGYEAAGLVGLIGGGTRAATSPNASKVADEPFKFTDKRGNEFTLVEDQGEYVKVENEKGGIERRKKENLTPVEAATTINEEISPSVQESPAPVDEGTDVSITEVVEPEKVSTPSVKEDGTKTAKVKEPAASAVPAVQEQAVSEASRDESERAKPFYDKPAKGMVAEAPRGKVKEAETVTETPQVAESVEETEQNKKQVQPYELGDFVQFFDEDAEVVANALGNTLLDRDGRKITGIPKHTLDQYRRKLAKLGIETSDLIKASKRPPKKEPRNLHTSPNTGEEVWQKDVSRNVTKSDSSGNIPLPSPAPATHPAKAESVPSESKQPWEMTAEEWSGAIKEHPIKKGLTKYFVGEIYDPLKTTLYGGREQAVRDHRSEINSALASGKLTPERAKELGHLDAYPELAKEFGDAQPKQTLAQQRAGEKKAKRKVADIAEVRKSLTDEFRRRRADGEELPQELKTAGTRSDKVFEKALAKFIDGMNDSFARDWYSTIFDKPSSLKQIATTFNVGDYEIELIDDSDITANASGESSASMEAQSRIAGEKARGEYRVKVDTRSGREIMLPRTVDSVDVFLNESRNPQDKYFSIEWRGGRRDGEIIDSGSATRAYKRSNMPPMYKIGTKQDAEYLINDLPKAHPEDLLDKGTSKFTGDNLELNEEAAELIRRLTVEAVKDAGDAPFFGVTLSVPALRQTARAARMWAKKYAELGYTPEQVKTLTDIANNLTKLATQRQKVSQTGYGVVYVFDTALPEETHHQLVMEAGGLSQKAIKALKAIASIWKSKKFDNEYKGISDLSKAIEIAAKLETGQDQYWDDISDADKNAFLNIVADDIIDNNTVDGVLNLDLDRYARITAYGTNTTTRDATRTEADRTGEEGTPSDSEPDRTQGAGARAEDSQAAAGSRDAGDASAKEGQEQKVASGFAPGGKEKLSKTPSTLRDKGGIPVEDRAYTSTTNAERVAFANDILDRGIDGAKAWLETQAEDNNNNAGATAIVGIAVMNSLGKAGRIDELNSVADTVLPMITDAAQTVQAVSIVSMYAPENAVAFATKVVKKNGKDITPEQAEKAADIARRMSETVQALGLAEASLQDAKKLNEQLKQEINELEDALDIANGNANKFKAKLAGMGRTIAALRRQLEGKGTISRIRTSKEVRERLKDIESRKDDILAHIREKFGMPAVLKMVAGIDSNAAFKKWFGDSKVVDKDGKPLRVYHGTHKDFDAHKSTKFASAGYFAKQPSLANLNVSSFEASGQNIRPSYLSIINPLDLSALQGDKLVSVDSFVNSLGVQIPDTLRGHLDSVYKTNSYPWSFLGDTQLITFLKNEGFDGIIYQEGTPEYFKNVSRNDPVTDTTAYIVFEPTQIKSIFNEGTFDPSNPNILKQVAPTDAVDQELLDYATLQLAVGLGSVTPDEFKKAINTLTNGNLTAEQLDEVHAYAVSQLRTQKGGVADAVKQANKLRREHYKAAEAYELSKLDFKGFSPKTQAERRFMEAVIAAGANGNYSDEAIWLAMARQGIPSVAGQIKALREEFGQNNADGEYAKLPNELNILADSQKILADAKRTLQGDVARKRDETLSDEDVKGIKDMQRALSGEKARVAREANNFYEGLTKSKLEISVESAVNFRRANLLSAIKTHQVNILGNVGFGISEEIAKAPAAAIDTVAAILTGEKTIALTPTAIIKGAKAIIQQDETLRNSTWETPEGREAGIKAAKHVLMYGGSLADMERHQYSESILSEVFKGRPPKWMDNYINYSFRLLGAEDAFFKVYAFRRYIEEAAKAIALTERKSDPSINVKERTLELIKNPTNVMQVMANDYALQMTFQNDNPLSDFIAKAKRGRPGLKAAIETLVPYDRTPTNIVIRTIEYSPAGVPMAIFKLKGKEPSKAFRNRFLPAVREDLAPGKLPIEMTADERKAIEDAINKLWTREKQRKFAQVMGRSTVGTTLFTTGMILAYLGLMAGAADYGDDDKKERDLAWERRKQGVEPGSILIPQLGVRIQLPVSPATTALTAGASFFEELIMSKKDPALAAMDGGISAYADIAKRQPYINATTSVLRDLGKQRYGEFVGNVASGYVPMSAMMRSISDVTDEKERTGSGYRAGERLDTDEAMMRRQWRGFRNSFLKGVPGARNYFVDESTSGVSPEERGGPLRRFIRQLDPFNTRSGKPSPVPEGEKVNKADYFESSEFKRATTDDLTDLIKFERENGENTTDLEKALRQKVLNARKAGTFTPEEAKKVNEILNSSYAPRVTKNAKKN